MKQFFKQGMFILMSLFFVSLSESAYAKKEDNIRVLLIGDSTTKGSAPNKVHPERAQLPEMITILTNAKLKTKQIETFRRCHGGETAESIFSLGRYKKEMTPYLDKGLDYIFIRYGINDWYHCKDIDKEFPANLTKLTKKLQKDFPNAQLILCTITPFLIDSESERMNAHIMHVAYQCGNLPVLDIYTPFRKEMQNHGNNAYWIRMANLEDIPAVYHEWIKPYTFTDTYKGKTHSTVIVDDNSLDPFFSYLPGWVNHHPNSAGYGIIANCIVNYLLTQLKE